MVWIHGGAFAVGSGNSFLYGPDHLVGAGIVLVTLNYRLGALGFLSLESEEVSGNMGLKVYNLNVYLLALILFQAKSEILNKETFFVAGLDRTGLVVFATKKGIPICKSNCIF